MNIQFKGFSRLWVLAALISIVAGLWAFSAPAQAQRHGRSAGPGWHGDIARFHEHDWHLWRGGHWVHQRHNGRWGWWWVVGGVWYFYPAPVYPYPNPWEPPPAALVTPPPGTVVPAPQTQYWYLCEGSNAYYPYAATCPGGWKQVPAVPH